MPLIPENLTEFLHWVKDRKEWRSDVPCMMLISIALLLAACNPSTPSAEAKPSTTQSPLISNGSFACRDSTFPVPDQSEDTLHETDCEWLGYHFRNTYVSDPRGTHFYSYAAFVILGNPLREKHLHNSAIFSYQTEALETQLNGLIQLEMEALRQDTAYTQCMAEIKPAFYRMDDMRVSFGDGASIMFSVDFGLGTGCEPASGVTVPLPKSEVEQYVAPVARFQ